MLKLFLLPFIIIVTIPDANEIQFAFAAWSAG